MCTSGYVFTMFVFIYTLGKGSKKKPIESVSMLIPPSDPPPPPSTVSALGYFLRYVFWIIGVVWYAVKQIL